MSTVKDVWVFAEKTEALAELCAGGHELGEKVSALVIGPRSKAEQAIRLGAEKVYWLGEEDSARMMEDYLVTIADLLVNERPNLLLIGATKRGKLMAGRLAARMGTSVLTDVMEFVAGDQGLQSKRMVYGGAAIRTEQSHSPLVIATPGSGIFSALSEDTGCQGVIEEVSFQEPDRKVKCLEKRPKGSVSVNLAAAKRVISVGRGLANQEDLKMIEELAKLIGAEIGCSRPIAEGVNWLPRETYIGVSGVMFKPELYIAVGISGQVQHMVGCNQARTIFAINKDKAAPVFSQSDYGIVGDLYKVIPVLIEKIKTGK
ncbi:electron transfer flavoprotein subunit alpha/FixB family protein [Desulfitobacterium hafniense]|uniref:Electron transfer flavoprotein alpha/beta-subunit N-terminal domain-containing protein n=1 Tax=Desulfitobacterium hafniense (strain Y51) TaxID=138119 RepID=Q24QV6_DESHY|nr:FAD-binding protein [Desulfitobacterium hafniense]BAE85586.1 hypothetical protein DSY3797 [Desulfitobacterium hafniense Y51]